MGSPHDADALNDSGQLALPLASAPLPVSARAASIGERDLHSAYVASQFPVLGITFEEVMSASELQTTLRLLALVRADRRTKKQHDRKRKGVRK